MTATEIAVLYENRLGLPLAVFAYDGEGAIGEGAFYSVPFSHFMDMVRADVDGDGDSDIVIGHNGGLSVAFNDGAGGFDEVRTSVINGEIFDIAGGDLDADGDLDFVGALKNTSSEHPIFLNDGDGRSWTVSTSTHKKRYYIEAVDLGDVNGDGLLDVIASVIASEGDSIRVFLNKGRDGSGWLGLADLTEHSVQAFCPSMTVADLNADLFADIAVACRDRDEIRVLLNRGCDGTGGWLGFSPPVVYPTVDFLPDEIKAWDMDRDGDLDLVTLMLNNVVSVRANDGQGGFNGECDCLIEHDSPGCNDPACDAIVGVGGNCEFNLWDANCVRDARRECTSCNRHVWTRFQLGVVTMGVGDLSGDTMPDVVLISIGVLSLLNTGAPPIGTDCNRNDQPDTCDLSNGSSLDENGDGRPDECTLEGDFNVDGAVDLGDLRRLLNCLTGPWIEAERTCSTRQDLTRDTKVDLADVAVFMTLLRH